MFVPFVTAADSQHFVRHYPDVNREGEEFKAFPVVKINPLFGTTYDHALLVLYEHSPARLEPYNLAAAGSLKGRRTHQLTLTDPGNLEYLVEALKALSDDEVRYSLYGNTSNNEVQIVCEEIPIEEPAAVTRHVGPRDKSSVVRFKACLERGHHRLEGHILADNSGGRPYVLRVCEDCGHTVADEYKPLAG